MISRPVAIPLFLLIAGILLLDWFAPAFVVGEHYSLHLGQAESFRYEIREENSPKKNWLCYTAKVTHYFDGQKWQKTKGKVLFCIPRSDKRHLEYASLVESSATPRLIENYPQSNFDYKKFMQRKRVFHTIYARNYSLSSEPKNKDLQYYAHKFNTLLKQRINRSELTSGNKALASSLLLGDKTSLDKQVRLSFSAAGIAHILCVSGLHIGLIVAMFDIFLKSIAYHFSMDYCFRCRLHPFFTQSCPDVEPCNADKSHRIQKRHNQRAVCVGFYHAFMFANVAVRCQLSTLLPCSFRNSRLQAPFGQMDRQICEQALDFGGKNSLHNHVGTTFHPTDCRLPLRNIPFAVLNLQFVSSSLCGHYPFYHYLFGMLCRCAVHKHNDSLHS